MNRRTASFLAICVCGYHGAHTHTKFHSNDGSIHDDRAKKNDDEKRSIFPWTRLRGYQRANVFAQHKMPKEIEKIGHGLGCGFNEER